MDWTDVEMELSATGRSELAEWCSEEVARMTKERDAAFTMTRCECASDEACRNVSVLREALETIARVSNDPAIVTCAKRALAPRTCRTDMPHLKVCKYCGLSEVDHHDYEPSMPEGCVCPPGEWGARVNDVCQEFMGSGTDCARCQHDEECHKGPNVQGQGDGQA